MTRAIGGLGAEAGRLPGSDGYAGVRARDFATLCKLRVTVMVVVTAVVGYAMGLGEGGLVGAGQWLAALGSMAGVSLCCMGASALNQVYERDTDAYMTRTRNRPMAAGRMGVGVALGFGLGLCALGVVLLWAGGCALAAWLGVFTIVSYALVYTPMKRTSSLSTVVGAVPGAMPPVLGYVAAAGGMGVEAWLLAAVLFLWQLPHFLALAWQRRDEYAAAGLMVLPVVEPDGQSTFRQVLLGSMALLPLSLLPTAMGVAGVRYFVVALVAGVVLLGLSVRLALAPERRAARAVFAWSLVYLPAVYLLMVVDGV